MTPLYRAAAHGEGVDDYRLRRMCAGDELARLRPGAFVEPSTLAGLFPEHRHRIELAATAHALRQPAVISHVSAAVMHGLPVWNLDLRQAHFTRDGSVGGYSSNRLRMHRASLADDEIVLVDEYEVTSVARTVLDLACSVPFEQAVVSGDGALNRGLVTERQLEESRVRVGRRHGATAAARAIEFMDRRSESVGESRSRVLMHRLGLPRPELQRVARQGYVVLGRVDFYVEEFGVVGEFDGRGKYERGRYPGEPQGEVVAREKQRENALRDSGAEVVRWTWSDLERAWWIRQRLQDAFARGELTPPPRWDPPWPQDSYAVRRGE